MSVKVGSQGTLSLSPKIARSLAEKKLDLISHSSRHLLITSRESDGEVLFAGRLGELSLVDLLSMLNMFRKTGVLRFQLTGGEKSLYFQQGEIIHASSTFPEEELGEVLLSLGKIDRTTLDQARQYATSLKTIGKVLVERQAVTPKDLWSASRSQVETIVYNLFAFQAGSFSFLSKSLDQEQIVKLSMSTQNMIMEGLRRIDERGLFLRAIGSLDSRVLTVAEIPEGLSADENQLMQALTGQEALVRDVLRKSGFGEFDGLRLLYQLKEKQLVRFEELPQEDLGGTLGELVKIFNAALKALHAQVVEINPQMSDEVRYFLRDLPQPYSFVFRDVTLRGDGTIDGVRVLRNLAGLGEGDKQRLLVDAMNELIFMECQIARRDLQEDQSSPLLQRVQEIARRIKDYIGRDA